MQITHSTHVRASEVSAELVFRHVERKTGIVSPRERLPIDQLSRGQLMEMADVVKTVNGSASGAESPYPSVSMIDEEMALR